MKPCPFCATTLQLPQHTTDGLGKTVRCCNQYCAIYDVAISESKWNKRSQSNNAHKCQVCDKEAVTDQRENGWRCQDHTLFGKDNSGIVQSIFITESMEGGWDGDKHTGNPTRVLWLNFKASDGSGAMINLNNLANDKSYVIKKGMTKAMSEYIFSQQPPKEQADTCNCHIDDDDGNINYCEKHEPKERKVSLEELENIIRGVPRDFELHSPYIYRLAQAILSLLNATEG